MQRTRHGPYVLVPIDPSDAGSGTHPALPLSARIIESKLAISESKLATVRGRWRGWTRVGTEPDRVCVTVSVSFSLALSVRVC
jgi:hypothetical protein